MFLGYVQIYSSLLELVGAVLIPNLDMIYKMKNPFQILFIFIFLL